MSRSYKKPCGKVAGCCSEKLWKRIWHKRHRHINNQLVRCGEEENFKSHKNISDPWISPSDGKMMYIFPHEKLEDTYWDPKDFFVRFFKKNKIWKMHK